VERYPADVVAQDEAARHECLSERVRLNALLCVRIEVNASALEELDAVCSVDVLVERKTKIELPCGAVLS
jgi:hypothetical protein